MRHYDELLREQRGPFTVVVDKTWEDLSPRDHFEEDDVEEICRKIDNYTYDWFMLRTRVFFQDVELAANYLGDACTRTLAMYLQTVPQRTRSTPPCLKPKGP